MPIAEMTAVVRPDRRRAVAASFALLAACNKKENACVPPPPPEVVIKAGQLLFVVEPAPWEANLHHSCGRSGAIRFCRAGVHALLDPSQGD